MKEFSAGRRLHVRFIRQSWGYRVTRLEVSWNKSWVNEHGVQLMSPVRKFQLEWEKR